MHPIVLTISTGRCGTSFLTDTFQNTFGDLAAWIFHEHLKSNITQPATFFRCYDAAGQRQMANKTIKNLLEEWKRAAERGPVVDFGWTMRSLVPYFRAELGEQFRTIFIHRHPVFTAASRRINGAYSTYNSPYNSLRPSHPRARFPEFKNRWPSMTPFEKCLYGWLEVNSYALEVKGRFPKMPFLEVKSRNVFQSNEELATIARFAGFPAPPSRFRRSKRKNRTDTFSLESRPIKDEWKRYQRHPDVVELATKLGYNMQEQYIARSMEKYQLPKGVLPYVRHKTHYWEHRARIGRLLRRVGLRH